MPGATTNFVGARVFSNLSPTIARIDTRNSTIIGLTGPAPQANTSIFALNSKVRMDTDDAAKVLALGPGLLQDAIKQFGLEGIVTTVEIVRTQHSALADAEAKRAAEINAIVGSAALQTGVWVHADVTSIDTNYPGLLLSPGYTEWRPTDGVAGFVINDGGEGYVNGETTARVVGGGGTGAELIISVNEAGNLDAGDVLAPGYGYRANAMAATGKIVFATNPAADTTVTIAGTVVTFKAAGAAGNQVNIGANLAATLTALAAFLNASVDAGLASVDYVATATELRLTAATAGAAGNTIAYATTVAGATAAGATLTGGFDALSVVIEGAGTGAVITATLGTVRNPVMVASEAAANRLIDCFPIGDADQASDEAALAWAADFKLSRNVCGAYPAAKVNLGAGVVTRPLSPHWAAAIVRRDKEVGNPYKAAWNKPVGILGTSKPIGYTDGDINSQANKLVQGGLGTVIEGNLLWAPFTTATDPTTVDYRSLKMIRTRRAADKAMLRPMRAYLASDMHPQDATNVFIALDNFYGDLLVMRAIVFYEILWTPSMNPGQLLQAGAMRVVTRYAETPDLTDLQLYSESAPEGYDALALALAAAINALGRPNIRVAA